MPGLIESRSAPKRRPRSFQSAHRQQRPTLSRCRLDSSPRLIAPPHSLRLPILDGVPTQFRVSTGTDSAVPVLRSLVHEGLLLARHIQSASTPADALRIAVAEIVNNSFGVGADQFGIEIGIADGLDEYRKREEGVLFFVWNNTADPQYIPLRPIYERLEGNPHRERLMASLYDWLYGTASRVFEPFGFAEAEHIYQWRREAYLSEREAGEDVDLEGEVEYADPAKVVAYIRESNELTLKTADMAAAIASIASIADSHLRNGFRKAHKMYRDSRAVRLPAMSKQCEQMVDDAAYYMDASPMPGLGISHWRDDPIVAWFDEHCRDQFEAGTTPRAPIILCFRPTDTAFFLKIVKTLPRMVRTVARLSEWVRFAEELENASHYTDRQDPGLSAETSNTDL
jgi:hypothetical protein